MKKYVKPQAYAACMKAKGYRESTSALDFWRGYDL